MSQPAGRGRGRVYPADTPPVANGFDLACQQSPSVLADPRLSLASSPVPHAQKTRAEFEGFSSDETVRVTLSGSQASSPSFSPRPALCLRPPLSCALLSRPRQAGMGFNHAACAFGV